ncbi:hypothetical protein [Saccharothrix hoggarensis]
MTVVEEAHRLLKNVLPGSPASHAVEMFAALPAEIRAYGEGVVIAEQIPAKIIPDVLKNTALKIVLRMPAADDRDAVGATMKLDEVRSRHVVSLPPGRAAVFADGMDRPVLLGIPLGEDRESLDVPMGEVRGIGMHTVACRPQCRDAPWTLRQTACRRSARWPWRASRTTSASSSRSSRSTPRRPLSRASGWASDPRATRGPPHPGDGDAGVDLASRTWTQRGSAAGR